MTDYINTQELFKAHIQHASPYRGGATRDAGIPVRYKLSSNENMLGPSPMALAAISDNLDRINEYSFENDLALRNALALHSEGGLEPAQFITANSAMELLDILVRGFVSAGSEVVLSSPTFMAYKNFSMLGGATVRDVPLRLPGYGLDVEGILAAISEKTKILFISNPNNPTGSLVSRTEMELLMEGLPDSVIVVYDEVYHHYVESKDYPRAIDYIRRGRNLVGLHSFSKAFGLAGLRVGYAFSTPEIAAYLQHIRRPFMINTLSTVAAIAALKDTGHIDKTIKENLYNKRRMYRQLETCGISYHPTEANFILMEPGIPAEIFVDRMMQRGVMVRNAAVMKAPGKVRVTVGSREATGYFIELLKEPAILQI